MQTAEERSKLVYRVRVSVNNKDGVLKQGCRSTRSFRCSAAMTKRHAQSGSFEHASARGSARQRGRSMDHGRWPFAVVRPGEMFGLIGPMAPARPPRSHALRAAACRWRLHPRAGHDPVKRHRAITAKVGYLSQRFSLYGDLSIDENIAFFAEIHGVADYGARRDALLEMTQLTPFRTGLPIGSRVG